MPAFKPNTHVEIGGNPVFVIGEDQQGNVALAYGGTTPTDTTPGFAPGAIFLNTTAKQAFINAGTAGSSLFSVLINGTTQAELTAEDATAIDTTWGQAELDVVSNIRTRVGEIEAALNYFGILGGA